jgi:radical SAM protein with 4Fe4S-binding SPASM domain
MRSQFPRYRFVLDERRDRTTVTAAVHGHDGLLNASAGKFLAQAATEPMDHTAVSAEDREFLEACCGNGWLTPDLRLAGTFRVATTSPVLDRIQIELSLRCNLSCSYCYSESGPTKTDVMDAPTVIDLVDQAERAGVSWVDLTGGEFLIFKGWQDVLSEVRIRGLATTIHTNGILLTERNAAFIRDAGVRTVQVSADSHEAALHDSIRGLSGAHAKLLRGIRTAKEAGLRVRVLLVAHRRNKDTFVESVNWFHRELGVEVGVDRVIAAGGAVHDPVALTTREYYELLSTGLPAAVAQQKVCESPSGGSPFEVAPECGVGHSFMYVTADGRMSLCPTMTHRESERFRGPSIKESTLLDAWQSSDLFNQQRFVNCENATSRACPAAGTCGGGCRSNAYTETGSERAPDYFACNSHKNPGPVFVDFGRRYADGHFGVLDLGTAQVTAQ